MGWGSKPGAQPQPLPKLDYDGPPLSEKAQRALNAKYAPRPIGGLDREAELNNMPGSTPETEPPAPARSDAKDQLAWHQLKSRKGWTDATLLMLLYEFVSKKQLFGELTQFVRRR